MNCANHSDQAAVAFCRTCGKPLCQNCTRDVRGVIYCESCLAARLDSAAAAPGTAPAAGFTPVQAPQPGYQPYTDPSVRVATGPTSGLSSGPNPAVAGILAGFFPFGVGAVYCSQYAKGLAHLLIFAMLIFASDHAGSWDWIFGIGIAFFYVYQIIDAVRTAKALQAGQPAPDPLGLGQSFGMGEKFEASKVPVGAVILIGLGVLFLLHTMGFWEFGLDRFWPLILVFMGIFMFYRQWERVGRACNCGRCRTRWLMAPSMVLLTGVLLLLHTTNTVDLDRSWPAWILAVGVIQLLRSTASSAGHVGPLPPGPAATPPTPPGAAPAESSSTGNQSTGTQPPSSGEVSNV
ncbi:MAG TPA: DUF5668 domain-containing protein [Candidatus Solibacter sp.]|nr:DUF5668 domain-containing protein [Candidatus Solibacter sp.]